MVPQTLLQSDAPISMEIIMYYNFSRNFFFISYFANILYMGYFASHFESC